MNRDRANDETSRRVKNDLEASDRKLSWFDCLGLIDPADRTWPEPPREVEVNLDMSASTCLIQGIDQFVAERADRPIRYTTRDPYEDRTVEIEAPLGAAEKFPDFMLFGRTLEERLALVPFGDELRDWFESRPESMRDTDGHELARVYLQGCRARKESEDSKGANGWKIFSNLLDWGTLRHRIATSYYLRAILILEPESARIDFLLDVLERSLADLREPSGVIPSAHPVSWIINRIVPRYGRLDHSMTREQLARFWRLRRWCDDGHRGLERLLADESRDHRRNGHAIPGLDLVLECHRLGIATDADLLDVVVGYPCPYYGNLKRLTMRGALATRRDHPGLAELVGRVVERILEIELGRGEAETLVSRHTEEIHSVPGIPALIRLLNGLGKGAFAREDYSYAGDAGATRRVVFSHLIRVSYPKADETAEDFAAAVTAAGIPEKRLIELAMYAPQWASFVERRLDWPCFEEAVWWMHFHTRGMDGVSRDDGAGIDALIASRTPLTRSDFNEGRADIAWFRRIRASLDDERWAKLEAAAKLTSHGTGHARAQLFANAMLGRLSESELLVQVREKRHQDSVRALGLFPVAKERVLTDEVLVRYEAIQEFLRTSRQFGAQRRESEKMAARAGMTNLANSAGYPDPMRLQWAMEARALTDLACGSISHVEGDMTVTLRIDAEGQPELDVVKAGKPLKDVPAKLKKIEAVKALADRHAELKKQVARMRSSLEESMVRGDEMTAAELRDLASHAMLARMLAGTVLVRTDDPSIMGYVVEAGTALESLDAEGNPARRPIGEEERFRVAHPHDLFVSGNWHLWQRDCFARERVQPFKQVFREYYPVTEQERTDGPVSRRYTRMQVHADQANALLGRRGWVLDPSDLDAEPTRVFHGQDCRARLRFDYSWRAPVDPGGLSVEGVRFSNSVQYGALPLDEVPPRVFSEAMRDLDLVVSVAHRGGVDPEASASTVEMRSALLEETLAVLKIANVKLEKNHAIIEGERARYSLHLGSGVVHLLPGGALCIVPLHAQHRGRLFLPFADDDPKTAEVISKVLMLARDLDIKDPGILEQIRARG